MNRLLVVICAIVLLICNACQDNFIDLENQNGELTTRAADMKFQHLVQQARSGDADAYKSIAVCYRDGDGVEKSWLNMIVCMQIIATKQEKTSTMWLNSLKRGILSGRLQKYSILPMTEML